MDVTLVLTHKCNLACSYCYAGEHHRGEVKDEVVDRAVELLFADGADRAQLGFFGGEPFLAFGAMKRAVTAAKRRAEAIGGALAIQCTTNGSLLGPEQIAFIRDSGMRVTVSIDGVQEAHDFARPKAGGGSSFGDVAKGLRALIAAGAAPEAMLVITPMSAPFVFRSVCWLWGEGVDVVRANVELKSAWDEESRRELREELVAVGRELVRRRLEGRAVIFQPFEPGMARACAGAKAVKAKQVVVGIEGDLYPCAPMVGEDRAGGPEAALRIGRLEDGVEAIVARIAAEGAGCGDGEACACAAYLETGDRATLGPIGRWYGRLCGELGAAAAAALDEARRTGEAPPAIEVKPPKRGRSFLKAGLILGAGGAAALTAMASMRTQGDIAPCDAKIEIDENIMHATPGLLVAPLPTAEPSAEPTTTPTAKPEAKPPTLKKSTKRPPRAPK